MPVSPMTVLPVELLASIAGEVQPQDLKNFVLSCKVFYSASHDALKLYRHLRERYCYAGNIRKRQTPYPCYHLPELLDRVLESPKIASHVVHFYYAEDLDFFHHVQYNPADYRPSFQTSLENLQLSNPKRETWWSDTGRPYWPKATKLIVGLLLHYLPNLRTFSWHSREAAHDLTDLLQPIKFHPTGLRPPLLPALKAVWLYAGDQGRHAITFRQVIPFLALPQIEYVNVARLSPTGPSDDLDATAMLARTSNLRELVLSLSSLGESLDRLLQLPQSLTNLTFVAEFAGRESRGVFPLGRAKHYDLERLKIRMCRWTDHIDREALLLHTKLVFLETDCFLTDDATIAPASDIKHYFPPSVQHITFTDSELELEKRKDYFRYFQQILELRRAMILPHLKTLTLRSHTQRMMSFNREIRATREACKVLSMEFIVDFDWELHMCSMGRNR